MLKPKVYTTQDIVLAAYLDEFKKWENNLKDIETDIKAVLEEILTTEQKVLNAKFFRRFKYRALRKELPEKIHLNSLYEKIDRLEKNKNTIELHKPNLDVYELGAIENTLFYVR